MMAAAVVVVVVVHFVLQTIGFALYLIVLWFRVILWTLVPVVFVVVVLHPLLPSALVPFAPVLDHLPVSCATTPCTR